MNVDLTHFSPEFAEISAGDTVITPNRRISAWLNQQIDKYKGQVDVALTSSNGSHGCVWESIKILPLSSWLDGLLEEARDIAGSDSQWAQHSLLGKLAASVLTSTQEKAVWEDIILQDGRDWIKPDGAAKQAQQAWSILNRWGQTEDLSSWDVNDNTHLFQYWLAEFQQKCNSNQWITQAETLGLIKQCVECGLFNVDGALSFYGFDSLEPAVKNIVDAFERNDSNRKKIPHSFISFPDAADKAVNSSETQAFADKEKEINAALQWLVTSNTSDPAGTYCVVAPDIADDRATIERICKRLIQPANYTHPGDNRWRDVVNVSAGTPLGSFGIVADALLLLQALGKPITRDEWGVLLRSPYWGASAHRFSLCSQFADTIAESKTDTLTSSYVRDEYVKLLNKKQQFDHGEDSLFVNLTLMSTQTVNGRKNFSEWADQIVATLFSLGWPGSRSESSQDYQLKQKFLEQVRALALYDEVVPPQTFTGVLKILKSALNETMFQVKTEQASMQVLGVLEASGLHFDGVWILSSDDQHWPESPAPNPFICQQLQRTTSMPNASAEREMAYAEFILTAFIKTSPLTIFSWHKIEGDSEFNVSPLLESLPAKEIAFDQGCEIYASPLLIANPLVERIDDVGPALPEGSKVKGGASIIKTQASCPFRAFALYRLGAKSIEAVEDGLSPAERGELLHASLERFWKSCQTYEQFLLYLADAEAFSQCIASNVGDALAEFKNFTAALNDAFLALEKDRLEKLVHYWLVNVEAKRTPFEIVSLEKTEQLTVSNLEVTVKADRIDRVEGGHTVIVDYKTGQKNRKAWEGDRPDDPQLPLYAVKHKDSVDGILFGVVKKGDSSLKGEVDDAVDIMQNSKSKTIAKIADWPTHVEKWEAVLTTLATDFSLGVAKVDPKNASSCDYCELTPFCRRKEF